MMIARGDLALEVRCPGFIMLFIKAIQPLATTWVYNFINFSFVFLSYYPRLSPQLPGEKVFLAQKKLLATANMKGKVRGGGGGGMRFV